MALRLTKAALGPTPNAEPDVIVPVGPLERVLAMGPRLAQIEARVHSLCSKLDLLEIGLPEKVRAALIGIIQTGPQDID